MEAREAANPSAIDGAAAQYTGRELLLQDDRRRVPRLHGRGAEFLFPQHLLSAFTATLQPRHPRPYLLKGESDAEPTTGATEDAGLCQVCVFGGGGWGDVVPLPTFLSSPLLPLQPLGRAEGGSSCWGVSLPRPVALPDAGPPPSHVTRPGHKKEVSTSVIASWNSDSATSPKTGCAWRAGCEQRGPGCPLSSSAVSAAATLYLSLTTWKRPPPPPPAQNPYGLTV